MLDEYLINSANNYSIDPAFNKDLSFAYQPSPEINLSELPPLSENWVIDLATIICEADPKTPQDIFERHIGKTSTFSEKNQLIKKLQLIHHRLLGNLDSTLGELALDERKALIYKLAEEISYCTEGLYNRTNIIVDLFHKPRNLAELLCQVRTTIVEEIASTFTEIHIWNRVSVIAASDGLGIKANFPEDRYSGNIADALIRSTLQKVFHKKFTPYHLPSLLIAEFIKFIPELEIEKNRKDGLSLEMREKIITLIQRFLPKQINENPNHPNYWLNYFKVYQDEEAPLYIKLVNIDWEKLYRSFFHALSCHYFNNPKKNTLVDCAYYNLIFKKKPNDIANNLLSKLFKEERYSDLLDQLEDLNARFPLYYKKMSKNKVFNTNFLALIDYLTLQLRISPDYSSKIILGFQIIINLDLSPESILVEKIANTLLLKNQSGFNLLMLGAQHNSALVKEILVFFNKNIKIIDINLIKNIFLMKNKDNLNALMIAIMHHSDSLRTMLEFIGKNIQDFESNLHVIFLEKHHNRNILMLAANQLETVNTIVNFFNNYIYSYTKKIFFNLFTQPQKNSDTPLTLTVNNHPDYLNIILQPIINYLKIDGKILNSNGALTLLMLAAKNQAEATSFILDFISNNIQKFDSSILKKIFLEKDQAGATIVMLAAQYQPHALGCIFRFIKKHNKLFPGENLPKLFLENNPEGYNCLMLAAESNPLSVRIILDFINSQFEFFQSDIPKILFAKNKKNGNSLILACHHPTALEFIINFINMHSENRFSLITLEDIFLEKHRSEFTLLMYAARDQPESLRFILEFIKKHPWQFPEKTIHRLITEKNDLEYNSLMLAVRNQPSAVASILNFIQQKPQLFLSVIPHLFLAKSKERTNILMIAAQYQPEVVKLLLDFIQNQPKIFPACFLNLLLVEHDKYGVNALMLAATYQTQVVKLLLSFLTKNIKAIQLDTIQEFVFKNIHDKKAANAVFFGGGYNFRKTVLSVTSQLADRTAINALLKFIDDNIDFLGMPLFIKLLTEQDKDKNYIFNPACAQYPNIMKNTLNLIASTSNYEELKPIQPLVADFILNQLVRWSVNKEEDDLFYRITCNTSIFLLDNFNLDRFCEYFDNLDSVIKILLCCFLIELDLKKIKEQNGYFFFKWFSSVNQEFQAGLALEKILHTSSDSNKRFYLQQFGNENSKLLKKSNSVLSRLYVASLKNEELKVKEMDEISLENDAPHPELVQANSSPAVFKR